MSFCKETRRYQPISFSFHIMVVYLISDRIKNYLTLCKYSRVRTNLNYSSFEYSECFGNTTSVKYMSTQVRLLTTFNSEQNSSYRALIYKYIHSRTLHPKRYSSAIFPVVLLKISAKILINSLLNSQVNQLNFTIYNKCISILILS